MDRFEVPDQTVMTRSWRWHPPVHSPLSLGALARSARAAVPGVDPRPRLAGLLARQYEADGVLLTDSGTSALRLAIGSTMSETNCDIVALPAYCCYDLATAAVGANARVVFYDIDPHALTPDLASLGRALAGGARSIVIAPLYGIPVPWEPVEDLARRYDAVVVEDAAQGHGAEWRGQRLGALGNVSVLSFGRGKGWTGGGGGALLWRGRPAPRYAVGGGSRAAGIRALAVASVAWALGRPSLYGLPSSIPGLGLGETVYKHPVPPSGMADVQAALAIATHTAAETEAQSRRQRAALLAERLPQAFRRVPVDDAALAGWLRLPIRVPGRGPQVARRLRRLGVAAGYPSTLPSLLASSAGRSDSRPYEFPGAASLVRDLITLPTHGFQRLDEIDALIRGLQEL